MKLAGVQTHISLRFGNLFRHWLDSPGNILIQGWKVLPVLLAFELLLLSTHASNNLYAAPEASTSWLTGAKLQAKLDSKVSLRLAGQSLRDSLEHLAEAYQVAIYLDRRVDPGQTLELQVTDVTLHDALKTLAEQKNLGLSQVGSTIYIGPAAAAKDILTLATLAKEEVEQVPQDRKAVLLKSAPIVWKELSTPRELIEQTAHAAGLKINGLELVPHDLWPACSWASMNVPERLTLLTIGFDLQVHISKAGDELTLVPRVSPAKIVKSYSAGAKPEEIGKKLSEYLPDAEFKASGGKLFVRARWEDHLQVQAALKGKPLTKTTEVKEGDAPIESSGIKVYTLTIQNKPLRPVLETLARQMNLKLQMDDEALQKAGIEPNQLMSLQVKEAQRDELWKAALSPLGLSFKVEGDTIVVSPAEK